jgi:hypothetical protein
MVSAAVLGHHRQLHQAGNQEAWWENLRIYALEIARGLWVQTHPGSATKPVPHDGDERANNLSPTFVGTAECGGEGVDPEIRIVGANPSPSAATLGMLFSSRLDEFVRTLGLAPPYDRASGSRRATPRQSATSVELILMKKSEYRLQPLRGNTRQPRSE